MEGFFSGVRFYFPVFGAHLFRILPGKINPKAGSKE